MATMRLRNTNPLGEVDLPLIGCTLAPGEEFEVDEELAGHAPSVTVDDDGNETFDPGVGLLSQVGNYEPVGAGNVTKADLLGQARGMGLDVPSTATKAEIAAAIEAGNTTEEIS